MNVWKCLLILALISVSTAYGQTRDSVAVNKLLDESKALSGTDSAKAINLAMQAKKLASDIGYQRGEA